MKVQVRLFATLRKDHGKELGLELDENATAEDVINKLGISKNDVAILLINGRDGGWTNPLKEGDSISIFPPVGGG